MAEYCKKSADFIAGRVNGDIRFIRNLLQLLENGATVPFIARYRKEMTGNMDEVRIAEIKTLYTQFQELEKRKTSVLESIREQGKLTAELERQILECEESRLLEDLYLPFKPKKQTRAAKARLKGLEPLAVILMRQEAGDVGDKAARFVKGEVESEEEALQGARDIIAEWINENEVVRNRIRRLIEREAFVRAKGIKGKEKDGEKYTDYFDYRESLKQCPSHRMLAIRRGEAEGFLKVNLEIEEEKALEGIEKIVVKGNNECTSQVRMAVRMLINGCYFLRLKLNICLLPNKKRTQKRSGYLRKIYASYYWPLRLAISGCWR